MTALYSMVKRCVTSENVSLFNGRGNETGLRLLPLHDEDGHIVILRVASGMVLDCLHDMGDDVGCAPAVDLFYRGDETVLAELFARCIHRLDDTIRIHNQHICRRERYCFLLERKMLH